MLVPTPMRYRPVMWMPWSTGVAHLGAPVLPSGGTVAGGGPVVGMAWRSAHALAALRPGAVGVEVVPSVGAVGRVLADAVRAVAGSPAFDTAAMDGYAVNGAGPWRVVGRVLAGRPGYAGVLSSGRAVEIATGAVVPAGTDAVLPYERCHRDDVVVTGPAQPRDHIRRAGEDVRPGDTLVSAGRVLTGAVVGALAQAGVDAVTVRRRPRVRLLVTGDEIVRSGRPETGQVRDAVSPLVAALVDRAGGDPVEVVFLGDDADRLHSLVAADDVDLVAVSGSSSVGPADHLRPVLAGLGARWHVDGVACRPGHPQALAETSGGRWLVGLPGNPFAALVAGLTLLEPAIGALAGRAPRPPLRLPVTGGADPYPDGVRLVPVLVDGDHAEVVPVSRPGSLRAAATADAVAVVDPQWTDGSPADLLPVP